MKDPFEVLGVERDSTKREIKAAYRKLAKEFHPDLHPDNAELAERFKEISSAYETLSNDSLRKRYAEANNITMPETGLMIPYGIAVPVLIAILVGIVMTFIATRLRFGRYVFAIGGNPEAAELSGINTRWTLMKVFGLMGLLCGISACISTARLNAATNAAGTLDELYVIASAVIGGTSLAGGIGTIYGAMLGALVMQSLQSGMTLLNFESAYKDMVVGSVLVFAVWLDQVYRRRVG